MGNRRRQVQQRELIAQASARGATEDELIRLERREASTLGRLREGIAASPIRASTDVSATRGSGRMSFQDEYGESIRQIFAGSANWSEFIARLEAIGLDVKAIKKKGKGRDYYGVAFAERNGKKGASGAKVGVPWEDLWAKYGALDAGRASDQANVADAVAVEFASATSAPELFSHASPLPISNDEQQLAELAMTKRIAVVTPDLVDRALSVAARLETVRIFRNRRRIGRQRRAKRQLDQQLAGRRPSAVEKASCGSIVYDCADQTGLVMTRG